MVASFVGQHLFNNALATFAKIDIISSNSRHKLSEITTEKEWASNARYCEKLILPFFAF